MVKTYIFSKMSDVYRTLSMAECGQSLLGLMVVVVLRGVLLGYWLGYSVLARRKRK